MSGDEIQNTLREAQTDIRERFGVTRLALFGSRARGDAKPDSDIDLLVEFKGHATFDSYMDLKFYLEELLRKPIDLVTTDGLRPKLAPKILAEAIDVA